jgi:hypothetical protein
MSEIPFVNRLGDAIETAITRQAPARRRIRLPRRRYLAVALAGLVVAGGGAAVAGLFTDPVEIGFGAVGCYEGTEPGGDVAIITDPTRSPVDICAGALASEGLEARNLIACQWPGHGVVVVVRGRHGNCTERALAPVPPTYVHARERATRLDRMVLEFEQRVDCLAPRPFAGRLQAFLRERGFAGWRAVVRGRPGPCGRVSSMGGTPQRSIAGFVDGAERVVFVRGAASLALEEVLWGARSPGGSLFDASGERCFTMAALERHVRNVLAPAEVPIRFRRGSMPPHTGVESPRGDRYAEGCAIFIGVQPVFDGHRTTVVVELWQR